jgi:protein-tyrosine-phosphatase
MSPSMNLEIRAARHAALGDPARLAIVDELSVLERVALIERSRSSGDGRRRYVHLLHAALDGLSPSRHFPPGAALFVCSANSARSQLAAALWHQATGAPATSAGTHPATRIHPGAVAAARRAGLDLEGTPHDLADVATLPPLVITVCDQAHEELDPDDTWLHWSVPDPVPAGTKAAFDSAVVELRDRIHSVVAVAEAS